MNVHSLILYHFVMECGKGYIRQIVSDKTMPEKVKSRHVSEVIEFLRACDLGYDLAEKARKFGEFLEQILLNEKK